MIYLCIMWKIMRLMFFVLDIVDEKIIGFFIWDQRMVKLQGLNDMFEISLGYI